MRTLEPFGVGSSSSSFITLQTVFLDMYIVQTTRSIKKYQLPIASPSSSIKLVVVVIMENRGIQVRTDLVTEIPILILRIQRVWMGLQRMKQGSRLKKASYACYLSISKAAPIISTPVTFDWIIAAFTGFTLSISHRLVHEILSFSHLFFIREHLTRILPIHTGMLSKYFLEANPRVSYGSVIILGLEGTYN